MAAALQSGLELIDLRRITAVDLDALLNEEIGHWRRELDWDFTRSADLVRKFTDLRALTGAALIARSGVAGYAYSVLEEHKGLVGDLYVRDEFRTPDNEYRLLSQVLEELAATPYIRRVESQLILFGWRDRNLPRVRQLQTFERDFLEIDLDAVDVLASAPQAGIAIEPWATHFQEAAAHLIAGAYVGHVDALINDQYRSVAGARRFLYNIVQYPGCGSFLQPASLAAFERETGWMCGLCLAGEVGSHVGHITQVCLSRDVRGRKLGYEMIRQSLLLMRLNGYKRCSLTVTSENRHALDMYLKLGFRRRRKFPAFVWEGL
jgi:ribosomal protein S18 acetylase RimI-like enzyme